MPSSTIVVSWLLFLTWLDDHHLQHVLLSSMCLVRCPLSILQTVPYPSYKLFYVTCMLIPNPNPHLGRSQLYFGFG